MSIASIKGTWEPRVAENGGRYTPKTPPKANGITRAKAVKRAAYTVSWVLVIFGTPSDGVFVKTRDPITLTTCRVLAENALPYGAPVLYQKF
jgi:hypothetical protein